MRVAERVSGHGGLAWLVLTLVVWIALVGCKSESAPPRTVLRMALESPRSLDPNIVTESEGGKVVTNTFEGLFVQGPGGVDGSQVRPGVAERWEISADGLKWTFTLRKEARWSDGEPVTAHDFEYSFLRILAPETAAEYASIYAPIKGALAYTAGEGRREDVGVRAIDDHTLELELTTPTAILPELLAFYAFMPVPRHVVERHGPRWTDTENWVSNGPYVLVENTDRVVIRLKKNPYYWDRDNVSIEEVEMRILPGTQAPWAAYEAGQIDMIEDDIPPGSLYNLWISASESLQVFPRLGVYMVVFNNKAPPFDDVRVRKAFNLAIDKSEITRHVTNGGEVPATSLVDPSLGRMTEYESVYGATFDPAAARALLAEAGYPGGRGLPPVVYRYNTNENHKKVAEALQQMWAQNLGVKVELANNEWKIYLDNLKSGDFQMGRYGWIADYVDPMTFLDLYESNNPNNYTNFSDPEYDRLIAAARNEGDPARRFALLHQAEQRFVELLPVIPLYYYTQKLVVNPRVRGVEPHLLGMHLIKYMRLEAPQE